MISNNPTLFPLTKSQTALYYAWLNKPESLQYNFVNICKLDRHIDSTRIVKAVKTVMLNHRIHFARICEVDGIPYMFVPEGINDFAIRETNAETPEAEAASIYHVFDLTSDILFDIELCHIKEDCFLVFHFHHIISDGTTIKLLFREIAEAYDSDNFDYQPAESFTIFDYALEEFSADYSKAHDEDLKFYSSFLEGVDTDSKPIPDVCFDTDETFGSRNLSWDIGSSLSSAVSEYAESTGVRESSVFMAGFAYSLAKLNGTSDSTFTTANNGRHDKRLSQSFGMFVKALPLHFNIDENLPVIDFIRDTQSYFRETMHHNVVNLNELSDLFDTHMEVSFIYQGDMTGDVLTCDGALSPRFYLPVDNNSDFQVMIFQSREKTFSISVFYNSALYSSEFISCFADMYKTVLKDMLTVSRLSDINPVSPQARAMIDRYNNTEYDYDKSVTLVDMFRKQAKATPENTCLVYKDTRYTYSELDNLTDIIASHLSSKGIGREKIVGILVPRNEYMLISALSVLKAGGAYLPLDPTYPPERINLMIADSKALIVLSSPEFIEIIDSSFKGEIISTDTLHSLERIDITLPVPSPNDLFALLYTSGSTGKPKGVMYQHSNPMVTVVWEQKFYHLNADSRIASYASFGFDANIYEMYPPIVSGGQLHIISDEIRLDLTAIQKYFNENQITQVTMTTQVARQLASMDGFTTLKFLSAAGEKLTPIDVKRDYTFCNLYGPSEASIITSAFVIDRYYKDIPIGKAVDNLKLYITDKAGKLLPPGAVGELVVSGPHVTRGYHNNPEKTAESYGINPFETDSEYSRIYRTGDIIRLNPDGNLQFIGRRDGQVKIRGFRVELTEVEEVIRRFPGISDATVAAFDAPSGGKFIAAFIVSNEKIDTGKLSDFIREIKPPYMVPSSIMQIDSIPLTQNHKVNKRALPQPKSEFENAIKPQNEKQQRIFDIASEVIGTDSFGINTDLFSAGLSSIGIVKLNYLLAQAFDVPFKISDFKTNNTIEKIERFINNSTSHTDYSLQKDYPLTKTQSGILVEALAHPLSTTYNIPALFKISSKIDIEKLKDAVIQAVDAHPYMKTVMFADKNGDIRAQRCDDAPVSVEVETGKLPSFNELVVPYLITGAPLYRIKIFLTDDGNYLFIDIHHIIGDGTGMGILLDDINSAYFGNEISKETFTGFEIALEEAANVLGPSFDSAKKYWNTLLSSGDFDGALTRAPETGSEAASSVGVISDTLNLNPGKLQQFCHEHRITPNAFFNAVFSYCLSKFAHSDGIQYATIHNGRSDSRFRRSITMLVKTIPVVTTLSVFDRIDDLMHQIGQQLSEAMVNELYSFAEMSHDHDVNADIMFIYQGDDFNFDTLCGEPSELIPIPSKTAKAPIAINVYLRNSSFEINAEYQTDSFCAEFVTSLLNTIEQCAGEFMRVERLSEVNILSPSALGIYEKMNDTDLDVSPLLGHQIIEKYALETPDALAIITGTGRFTFEELNESANKVASTLINLGVQKDNIIGVIVERDANILIAEIGIMKAGCAFLPIIPTYPDDRIEYCLTDSESSYVITTRQIVSEHPELFAEEKPYKALCMEDIESTDSVGNPNLEISDDTLAYCIYTSGSTGTPKGVMIEHRNFRNFLTAYAKPFTFFNSADKSQPAIAMGSFSFDLSIYEMYLSVCSGHPIYIAREDDVHNPMALGKIMKDNNIGSMCCTPSFLTNMVTIPEFAEAVGNLKTILAAAEAFPKSLYGTLRKLSPSLQIANGYGPTECTVGCSTKVFDNDERVTIGNPVGNFKLYVMDGNGNILPPYASGELIICGEGVGRGYVKLPEKTDAAFFEVNGLRAYHSGDLVRLTADGEIEFAGRIDNQVKLRGFRVELDEIENVICSFESVKQSKVIMRNNGSEDYLAAFFTASDPVDTDSLTDFLKSKLTYYMVPSVIMQLDEMPLTPNGKIDKKALPEAVSKPQKQRRRAPKKSLEQKLCEIFSSVLSLDEVYADDNFFELGGTSLSASKVTMLLMSENIEIKYGDIFDHPTPAELSDFIESRDKEIHTVSAPSDSPLGEYSDVLKYNTVKHASKVSRQSLGNVLLTGAVGFLGIHILYELLQSEQGHIYCLVRKGEYESSEVRLRSMLVYYFGRSFEDELKNRITIVNADITSENLDSVLSSVHFDTLINCAACVKHFSASDILTQINVHGVENLIEICMKKNARLIQISTTSIPGMHTKESFERGVKMHENELFVIDDMDNKYCISKYTAEKLIFEAVRKGLRAKVIRVGNLMGRHSDGEFQVNLETNMFISGIRGFATMGKYPISHMTDPMKFSPIDCTAKAVVLLSGTNDEFTAFNADNRYGFDEMKIIDACNRNGIIILPEDDDIYYEEYNRKLGDDRINSRLNALAAYDIKDAHAVETDNLFTTNILYRIGFSWPLVDDSYLDRAINSILTLDYFSEDSL